MFYYKVELYDDIEGTHYEDGAVSADTFGIAADRVYNYYRDVLVSIEKLYPFDYNVLPRGAFEQECPECM